MSLPISSKLCPRSIDGLRLCVRPEFAGMPAEDLEQIVDSSISGMPASIAEDFMKSLGSLGKAVGPTLQHNSGYCTGSCHRRLDGRSLGCLGRCRRWPRICSTE